MDVETWRGMMSTARVSLPSLVPKKEAFFFDAKKSTGLGGENDLLMPAT